MTTPGIKDIMTRTRLLSGVPAFANIPRETVMGIAKLAREDHFDAGKVVIAEGEVGTRVFLIMSGCAEASCKTPQGSAVLATLNPGFLFGEIAVVVPNTPRTATVKALTPLTVISFSLEDLNQFSAEFPAMRQALEASAKRILLQNFIQRLSPFSTLPLDRINRLITHIKLIAVAANTPIIKQGERGHYCYLLKSGSVDVSLKSGDAERVVATLYPGALFGEASLLTSASRNSSVVSREPCELLAIDQQALLDAIAADRQIAARMMELLWLRDRPYRKEGVLEQVVRQDERGTMVVLKDPETGVYYRLTTEGKFVWDLIDGSHNLRDLALAYFEKFKAFSPQAIAEVIGGLGKAGLLRSATWSDSVQRLLFKLPLVARIAGSVRRVLEYVVILRRVDQWFTRWYDRGVRYFFSTPAQVVWSALTVAGVASFIHLAPTAIAQLPTRPWWQWLLMVALPVLLSIVPHELAHGFAVKHFGREVLGVGVGWYWFGPIAFVDTSDMWLTTRWPRVAVSLAGPFSNLVLAALPMIAVLWIPSPFWVTLSWVFAAVSYLLVLLNLNPLMEYDGYYVLSDFMDRPNLRRQSLRWLFRDFPAAILHPSQLKGHWVELVYGLTSVFYTTLAALLTLWILFLR
jgi:putative peptide zinc metalloprotease protein